MKNLKLDNNLLTEKNKFIFQDSLIFILNTEKLKKCFLKKGFFNFQNENLLKIS